MKQTSKENFTGRDGRTVGAEVPGVTGNGADFAFCTKSDIFYS